MSTLNGPELCQGWPPSASGMIPLSRGVGTAAANSTRFVGIARPASSKTLFEIQIHCQGWMLTGAQYTRPSTVHASSSDGGLTKSCQPSTSATSVMSRSRPASMGSLA